MSEAFGYIDDGAKREVRRALMKAIAIPGYQVPYASRDMPIARGFGTGGLQITLSLLGPDDVVKVIDQGSDTSVNAVSLKTFLRRTCPGITDTDRTQDATVIQTRHRIPERPLRADQILVLQVPYPDPLVLVEPNMSKRRAMHAVGDYARLWTKLYEDIVGSGAVTISHRYPTQVHGHYVIDPSPIPRWDVSKLHQADTLFLFGAGREKRIYAIPPYTDAIPLSFTDVAFAIEDFVSADGKRHRCRLCGATDSFLDELVMSDATRVYECSDTDYCKQNRADR